MSQKRTSLVNNMRISNSYRSECCHCHRSNRWRGLHKLKLWDIGYDRPGSMEAVETTLCDNCLKNLYDLLKSHYEYNDVIKELQEEQE